MSRKWKHRGVCAAALAIACVATLSPRSLARPTDGELDPRNDGYEVPEHDPPFCSDHKVSGKEYAPGFCIHWVDTGDDAPPGAAPGVVPDFVTTTAETLDHVWDVEIEQLGFRPPKADTDSASPGPDGRLDIYFADIGKRDTYGYCESDDVLDPRVNPDSDYTNRDFAVYCVFDNDFADEAPPDLTALQLLQVTAAHEFFHAIQCAYDCYEDPWLVEGTAAMMEDVVYDDVNENRGYLALASALESPQTPIDIGRGGFEFGAWLFWRFLTEQLGTVEVIREIWEQVDASPRAPDMYSLEGLEAVLDARGSSISAQFSSFGLMNALPSITYEEGEEQFYPQPPFWKRYKLAVGETARATGELDHLSNRYVKFRLGRDVPGSRGLRIKVDFAGAAIGHVAAGFVTISGSERTFTPVTLDAEGKAVISPSFAPRQTRAVILVLTNTGTEMDCAYETTLSCGGYPLDDDAGVRFSARHLKS